MVDVPDQGRRPLVLHVNGRPADTREALACCSGVGYGHSGMPTSGVIPELAAGWGPVLELWEGYASDPDIRLAGSSGGVATALALHAVEQEGMSGVLHITARKDAPHLNETVYSSTREELMAATGSRYAPASPCERLDLVEAAPSPSVLIGKPCDIGGAALARARRPLLDEKLGLTIAIFCAGTPSTRGTLEMIRAAGVTDLDAVTGVRYRGNGWPGAAEVRSRTDRHDENVQSFTYDESWGAILQKHRQWRCHVCADHTGEMADVAVGDPWYRPTGGDPGRSLVLARTERGRAAVRRAVQAGALTLEKVEAGTLPASQMNLLRTRGSVWGRSLVLRTALLPAPRFRGMPAFRFWWRELSMEAKGQSTIGTFRRIRKKRLGTRALVMPAGRADDGPPPGDGD
ncbi:coenzyme F420 hydrogenase subunit beta [Blastococcus colisei]|uniref:Coenzyme F420 hydrogenase subunit beta n=1 Tax=Blastococcus colisei TaxID=1564162 RepID=A0A543P1J5_9ACTN|nr:Coenzyme F420 hydrogenase/dehydrogenase, beta subunit C-terminal domain [Blastococcus colisei]TQN37938.1 coenzyme F420 hydrogenase subunit beta [Blastococcus colisei]